MKTLRALPLCLALAGLPLPCSAQRGPGEVFDDFNMEVIETFKLIENLEKAFNDQKELDNLQSKLDADEQKALKDGRAETDKKFALAVSKLTRLLPTPTTSSSSSGNGSSFQLGGGGLTANQAVVPVIVSLEGGGVKTEYRLRNLDDDREVVVDPDDLRSLGHDLGLDLGQYKENTKADLTKLWGDAAGKLAAVHTPDDPTLKKAAEHLNPATLSFTARMLKPRSEEAASLLKKSATTKEELLRSFKGENPALDTHSTDWKERFKNYYLNKELLHTAPAGTTEPAQPRRTYSPGLNLNPGSGKTGGVENSGGGGLSPQGGGSSPKGGQ